MATYNGHNEDASGNILLSIGNGMTATVETSTKASQAYTKGALLYYNNRLCKATAAIAKNATFTVGTNIAYTSLGAELTSHLRASDGNEFYFDYKDGKPGYYPTASKTASQFVPFGGSCTPVVISIGDSSSEYYMYSIDAGTEYQLPNYGRHVYCVTGDTNASVTIANFSSSTAVTTTVRATKLGDSGDTTLVSTTPSTFPRTFTGYEVYKIVTANNVYKYKFTVNY